MTHKQYRHALSHSRHQSRQARAVAARATGLRFGPVQSAGTGEYQTVRAVQNGVLVERSAEVEYVLTRNREALLSEG